MPSRREPHWPKRWARDRGVIYYRPRQDEKHLWDGKSFYRLGATEAEAWAEWYARTGADPGQTPETLADAMDRYQREILPDLAPQTQRDYRRALILLRKVFGRMLPRHLKPQHVYAYMSKRPKVSANRERAVLSAVVSRCVEWGMVERNLVREVKRRPEKARDRYVQDGEVAAFLEHCSPVLRAYVRLKLLTGLRQGEILRLRLSDWDADAEELSVPAAKGGKAKVYWGKGLAGAIAELRAACARPANVRSLWLMPQRSGRAYSGHGFRTLWQRAMDAYVNSGGERFTDHDLRAKVASDAEAEHARELMGHRSMITERVYRRKPSKVVVLEERAATNKAPHGKG